MRLALVAALVVCGAPEASAELLREEEAGGTHYRLETRQGPVHVWTPRGYSRRGAGLVLYVHGFYVHVDEAWREHALAQQFAASGLDALFIAPEAPANGVEQPVWTDLQALLTTVIAETRVRLPTGPWVAVGHSGAYRALVEWLDEPGLRHLVLVDALYGSEDELRRWLEGDPARQMTLVVKGTGKWADPFVSRSPYAVTRASIPEDAAAFTRRERRAKLLLLQSQYGHFELVTEKRALPVLLGRTGVPRLPQAASRPRSVGAPASPAPRAPRGSAP